MNIYLASIIYIIYFEKLEIRIRKCEYIIIYNFFKNIYKRYFDLLNYKYNQYISNYIVLYNNSLYIFYAM